MAYWLFQANPTYYRILDAIRDLETMPWLVTRYKTLIQPDDGVLIWVAGANAGIYAIAPLQVSQQSLTQNRSAISTTGQTTNASEKTNPEPQYNSSVNS